MTDEPRPEIPPELAARLLTDTVLAHGYELCKVHWGHLAAGLGPMIDAAIDPGIKLDLIFKRQVYEAAHRFIVELGEAQKLLPPDSARDNVN